jgi:hypothetical protein
MNDDKNIMTSNNQLDQKNRALDIASKLFADSGFCTHYHGYTCDKGFPMACPACIRKWLLKKAREELQNE